MSAAVATRMQLTALIAGAASVFANPINGPPMIRRDRRGNRRRHRSLAQHVPSILQVARLRHARTGHGHEPRIGVRRCTTVHGGRSRRCDTRRRVRRQPVTPPVSAGSTVSRRRWDRSWYRHDLDPGARAGGARRAAIAAGGVLDADQAAVRRGVQHDVGTGDLLALAHEYVVAGDVGSHSAPFRIRISTLRSGPGFNDEAREGGVRETMAARCVRFAQCRRVVVDGLALGQVSRPSVSMVGASSRRVRDR